MIFRTEDGFHDIGLFEIGDGIIDVARQFVVFAVAFVGANGGIVVESQMQQGIGEQIGIGVGPNAAQLEVFSLPLGRRIIAVRSLVDTRMVLGASKLGSRRR